ncbi:agmatine/peptidylarginine deiminase [uncultured Roseibium sp.]|uniref:agmatine deiminase family protein n=1 Tax=uncultured Roseibium sp. TaxID=1936171 RepID=UPI0026125350|nr:agmatine deiminase family protein [uncultured Roseibium sp.]
MATTRLHLLGILWAVLLVPSMSEAADFRVPAEWESQAAVWMQWPGKYEAALRPAFADIIRSVQKHESLHLLASTSREQEAAQAFLAKRGVSDTNITWHQVPVDNAWMRDNGPIYLTNGTTVLIQNWDFTGWDGTTGADYSRDDKVPGQVAGLLDMEIEDRSGYVLEKGNLEVNGAGIAMLNWDCQDQRNPGLSKAEHEDILKNALGLHTIIWSYGHDPDDLTTGHIDGAARFVNATTVAIADTGADSELRLAEDLRTAGFKVEWYPGDVNWLVGDGYVVAMSELDAAADRELREHLQLYFPGRRIYLIDAWAIADSGGGIHCVTNDQPDA